MAYGKIKADTLVYDNSGSDVEVTLASIGNKAPLADPTFTGTVTIPTPTANDNTTKAASTAYVQTELGDYLTTATATSTYAPKADPTFTGTLTCYDLTVNGTTTTVNSATLTVDDKNIELGSVTTPTDTTADGGGITLKGATDKEIKWVNSTDAWTFNQNIAQTLTADGGITTTAGGNHAIQIIGDANRSADGNTLLSIHGKWNGTNVATIDLQAGNDTTNKDNGQIVFYTAASGSPIEALRINEDQTAAFAGVVQDSKGDVRSIPINSQSSAYVLVAGDAGKMISTNSGVTINTSVFSAGDAVSIVNNSGSAITITQGSSFTIYNTVDAATGNRTLAGRGMVTLWFVAHNYAYLSGSGVS